jgi:AcrR family transcriptional regulator
MVNPTVQTRAARRPATTAARPRRTDGEATRQAILEAAARCLRAQGYANLSLRDIARDAGVNHALINYHFQGRQQLVLAVLDDANRRLLDRQARMYEQPVRASEKWQRACEFYREDLESGFVRLLMELMGASFTDAALRREFVPRMLAWHRVVESAVEAFVRETKLDLPVSTRAVSAWICWFWMGMEAGMTLGIEEADGHQQEALAAVASLLRRVERAHDASSASAPGRSKTAARKGTGKSAANGAAKGATNGAANGARTKPRRVAGQPPARKRGRTAA